MNALAQGGAGLAMVMGLALLCTGQAATARLWLTAQSAGVAVAAIASGTPFLAVPPVLLTGLVWLQPPYRTAETTNPTRVGSVSVGLILTVLCRADTVRGAALAIVLLALLTGGTRRHPSMWLVALVALQNGIALMAGPTAPPLLPVACLLLPLPFAVCVLLGRPALPAIRHSGWIALGLTASLMAAVLAIRPDGIALVFAPLLAFTGTLRAWAERDRGTTLRKAATFLRLAFSVVAICAPTPVGAWIAIILAIGAGLWPTVPRIGDRAGRDTMAVALAAGGLGLFSLAADPGALIGDFSRFVGSALIAACIPELAAPLVILLLRHTGAAPLTDAAALLLTLIASAALVGWAVSRTGHARERGRHLGYIAMAALSVGLAQASGWFAAIVLLMLVILADASVPAAATTLVVLPGVALVALAAGGAHASLLLPLALGLIPALRGLATPWSLPRPVSLLPLGIAALFGWCAPAALVAWLQALAVR